jgi:hypothetical protein
MQKRKAKINELVAEIQEILKKYQLSKHQALSFILASVLGVKRGLSKEVVINELKKILGGHNAEK